MRDFLKAVVRHVASAGFWPLVLLALPNCALSHSAITRHLTTGDNRSSAIMCDIERYQGPTRRCATRLDLDMGSRLASAAERLVSGEGNTVGLDYSPAAQAACGADNPQAIDFEGPFPKGLAVCLNCGVIPVPHADATAVCVARCRDLIEGSTGVPRPPDIMAFCTANAHPSTNFFPSSGCYEGACSIGGTLLTNFADPRRFPEPVVWTDLIGTNAVGSTLTRDAATTGGTTADFNAGAVSRQWITAPAVSTHWITANDAYVEFQASETNLSHVVGLSQVSGACPDPCTDSDPSFANVTFAISLNSDGRFYVFEGGAMVTGPGVNQSFGTYAAGERFRVKVKANSDGTTATVSYSRIVGTCIPGNRCNDPEFYTHGGPPAVYPFRVDTSFREQGAALANVSMVRIQ